MKEAVKNIDFRVGHNLWRVTIPRALMDIVLRKQCVGCFQTDLENRTGEIVEGMHTNSQSANLSMEVYEI